MATRAATASTPTWEFLVAAAGHVLLAALAVLARCGAQDAEPLFKPEDVMVVEMSGPPKNVTRMPQRAERAPDPAVGAPTAPAQPPPPNPSDMAFQTPDAKVSRGDPKAEAERERLQAELRRRSLLDDLDAPIGTEDRAASSPEGTGDVGSSATGGVHDPELAKWVAEAKRRVGDNWKPLISLCRANPSLAVRVRVEVEPDGTVSGRPEIAKSSGNVSFDEAARRAVEMTPTLPPLPARFPNGLAPQLVFEAKECK